MCKLIITTTNGNQIEVKGEIQKKMDDAIKAAGSVANKSKELAQKLAVVLDLYNQIDWQDILKEGEKKPTFPDLVGQKCPGVKPSMAYKYAQAYVAIGRKYPTIYDALSIGKAIALVALENDKTRSVLGFFEEFGERLYSEAVAHNAPIEQERAELENQLENAGNDTVKRALQSAIDNLHSLYDLPDNDGTDGNPSPDSIQRYGIKHSASLTDDEFKKMVALYRNDWMTPEPKTPTLDNTRSKAATALENLLAQWVDAPDVVRDALKAIKPASKDNDSE